MHTQKMLQSILFLKQEWNGHLELNVVQLLSPVWLFPTPCTAAWHASLPITNSQGLLKLMSIESLMPCDHLILCNPLLLLPSIFPSIRIFSNESTLCYKGQSIGALASVSILTKENSGLISFKIDWLDLLAVQGTLKSLLQHHSSKASILQWSAFFILQPSHPYMTTGKTIALTRHTFVGKVMSLSFNILSRFLIAFLPRSKRSLIPWLQSPFAVILEPKKIKPVTVSIVSPSIHRKVMGLDRMIIFWTLSFRSDFSLSSFTFIRRLFSSPSLSAIRGASSAYLKLLMFIPGILIPACVSSSPVFHMMYSAYKLNKQVTIYSLDILLPQFVELTK